jgi:hypothetical protein
MHHGVYHPTLLRPSSRLWNNCRVNEKKKKTKRVLLHRQQNAERRERGTSRRTRIPELRQHGRQQKYR